MEVDLWGSRPLFLHMYCKTAEWTYGYMLPFHISMSLFTSNLICRSLSSQNGPFFFFQMLRCVLCTRGSKQHLHSAGSWNSDVQCHKGLLYFWPPTPCGALTNDFILYQPCWPAPPWFTHPPCKCRESKMSGLFSVSMLSFCDNSWSPEKVSWYFCWFLAATETPFFLSVCSLFC